jgi:hypothetical protein
VIRGRRRALVALSLLAFAGCGDEDGGSGTTSPDRQAVQDVVYRFWDSYERAQPRVSCQLMSPRLRAAFERALAEARPSLRARTCAELFPAAFRDPADQPPAIQQAAEPDFERVSVDGERATVTFMDGREWRFEKAGSRWLIAAFPILPPSISESGADRSLS